MNILFVGMGAGSFEMRGRQLGAALGARVMRSPGESDWRWADVAVLVKRAGLDYARHAHRYDVPIVWDVLDCWQQPEQNQMTADESRRFIADLAARIKPAVMIAATQQMATDIGGVYIPHHGRLGLSPTPSREHVKIVAYDGQTKYLGRWLDVILRECESRGWHFLVNPPDLTRADLFVAFRDGKWDGWICQQWKSGVKIGNAMIAGRPIVTQPSAAFTELQPVGSAVEDEAGLARAFDRWTSGVDRQLALAQPLAGSLSLDQVAARYRLILQDVGRKAA